MEILNRDLTRLIEEWLFREKIIILYGARQVGAYSEIIDHQSGSCRPLFIFKNPMH